jgi:hypothetical protein
VLREYVRYYHGRPHRGLCMQPPLGARWLPPCDVLHPRTSSLDLSSLAFTTNTTRGPPETDRRGADRERRGAGPSHVRALLPRSIASDPGVAGPRSGAAPLSPRPIPAAV